MKSNQIGIPCKCLLVIVSFLFKFSGIHVSLLKLAFFVSYETRLFIKSLFQVARVAKIQSPNLSDIRKRFVPNISRNQNNPSYGLLGTIWCSNFIISIQFRFWKDFCLLDCIVHSMPTRSFPCTSDFSCLVVFQCPVVIIFPVAHTIHSHLLIYI